MKGVISCGCGKCTACTLNKRREWTSRIMLESLCHRKNAFLTLTYDDEHLPDKGSLVPEDLQGFLKRLRARLAPREIRFYGVGEYGDKSYRPHYHLAVFGLSGIAGEEEVEVVKDCWKKGFVMVSELTVKSAAYVAGYVTKKMVKKKDPELSGKHSEFQRMSLKPGLGAKLVPRIIDLVSGSSYAGKLVRDGDVPNSLMSGVKGLPLGRYLRGKIREGIGRDKKTPEAVLGRYCEEVSQLLSEVKADAELEGTPSSFLDKKSLTLRMNTQKLRNVEARAKIFDAKRSL